MTESRAEPAQVNTTEKPKKRFIAINILPPRENEDLEIAKQRFLGQLNEAIALGFTHVWINPICKLSPQQTLINKNDLDTGVTTTLYQSLYTIDDPLEIISFFKDKSVQRMIADAKKRHLTLLVDFAWIYGGFPGFSTSENEDNPYKATSLIKAKQAIDMYIKELGFSGLRIDAASHIQPSVRQELYQYIKSTYPDAIIFEEVLFDRTEKENIEKLVANADEKNVYSDFVTSNIFYQKADVFGALPRPDQMGDSLKLQLAQNNGVGFTGNHDLYSVGWCAILAMAAKRAVADSAFMEKISALRAFPISKEGREIVVLNKILQMIKLLAESDQEQGKTIEELVSGEGVLTVKFLLPFAMEISHELLNFKLHPQTLSEFKTIYFEKILERTLTSPSGYFILSSELNSIYETQRIFTNKQGNPLHFFLLRAEDLLSMPADKLNQVFSSMKEESAEYQGTIPESFESVEIEKSKKQTFNNKNLSLKQQRDQATKGKASAVNKAKVKGKKKDVKYDNLSNFVKTIPFIPNAGKGREADNKNNMRVWLPYVIDYVRNNPKEAGKISVLYQHPLDLITKEKQLCEEVGIKNFVKQINEISRSLSTMACVDYHTFFSLDKFKIIVRCSPEVTEIIIVNTMPENKYIIDKIDIEKIALWYQARCFSIEEAAHAIGESTISHLNAPFNDLPVAYVESTGWYSSYWASQGQEMAFNDSYNRIMGTKANHQTKLYLSSGLDAASELSNINVISVAKTEKEKNQAVFHQTNKKITPPSFQPDSGTQKITAPQRGSGSLFSGGAPQQKQEEKPRDANLHSKTQSSGFHQRSKK